MAWHHLSQENHHVPDGNGISYPFLKLCGECTAKDFPISLRPC